ncbi:hypothetical protein [Sphingobacterium multivorum]|nr:hypothetical protein [Sphingobacterium multivorum]
MKYQLLYIGKWKVGHSKEVSVLPTVYIEYKYLMFLAITLYPGRIAALL